MLLYSFSASICANETFRNSIPMTSRPEHNPGTDLIERLREILRRCEATGKQVNFPGEGGERRFRLWLATEFFSDLLDWPGTSVVQGERFDLILRDDSGLPVITIETKTPYHKASTKERCDFEKRLSAFPTLRYAIFTSGNDWERYLIEHNDGVASVLEDAHFELSTVGPLAADRFFEPLRYHGKVLLPEGYRYRVSKDEPFIQTALMRLTSDLEASIAELMAYFNGLFHGLREGLAGKDAQSVANAVYSRWSSESLRITPNKLAEAVCETLRSEGANTQKLLECFKAFGFEGPIAQQVAESILGMSERARLNEERVAKALWPIFEPYIRQLCAQTAHVQLARALLYRVGEDEGVFDTYLSGTALTKILSARQASVLGRAYPATEALESVRNRMQSFLPSIYILSEFDWWMVKQEYRPGLTNAQRAWLLPRDEEFERLNSALLQRMNRYSFKGVDVDIWRNLYENYLPADERRRLGGFYTPDALVNLVLDLADYTSDTEGLCQLSFIDPSCGSGAFVTTALGRLLTHLSKPMPCHQELFSRNKSNLQKLEAMLRIVSKNANGVDLHPFASFLTTLNVLFAVLNLYVRARRDDPEFVVDLNIFAWDSLEPPSDQPKEQLPMFAQMNARVQRTEDAFDRYKNIIRTKFDRVFGNPPWGGVLNGPLAPVYDTKKKQTYKKIYPSAAQGKYDVYGLFMERSLKLLKDGGEFALITQGTYLEKEWAAGLRTMLAHNSSISWIVDLNPFGQLFFKAMNAPCVTVAKKAAPAPDSKLTAILSKRALDLPDKGIAERQRYVAKVIRDVASSITSSQSTAELSFAEGSIVAQTELQETAKSRWNLSPARQSSKINKDWYTAAELLEVRQGVTPGGCLEVFLLDEKVAYELKLEKALVHRAIKSRDLERWSVAWHNRALFYPYRRHGKNYVPAFTIDIAEVEEKKLSKRLTEIGLEDALDFDLQIDEWEREIVRKSGVNQESAPKLLQHRIALKLVQYPNAARYLSEHYSRLESRVFKKKNIRRFNRRWYEYLWPRDAHIILAKEKILSPRLIRSARFALDTRGHLSDDACLFLQPTSKTHEAWSAFAAQMKTCLGREATRTELLTYCLCFLNSTVATKALTEGRQPTPKGSYQVTEQSLREVPIAPPSGKRDIVKLLDLANEIITMDETFASELIPGREKSINEIVLRLLGQS
jgi:hypothetical protein